MTPVPVTVTAEHGLPVPAELSRDERKRVLFGADPYFRQGWAKVELGLGRGKTHEDRRDHIAERESRREMDRAMSRKKR